ncbi:MAG TPA: Holliday junction resolvase RuvX [Jatrophihabitans sp.]|nr:Holliday junction resolvase RuvX [Jatrophihabitans sp.]
MPDQGPRPRGSWLGVDVGAVRIGVARTDPDQILAVPVRTVRFDSSPARAHLAELTALVTEFEAVGVVVGLPRTLAGREGPAAQAARELGDALAVLIEPVPVRYVDERMTTVVAQRNLSTSGVRAKAQRAVVDQAAAVEILQLFLASSAQPRPSS